MPTNIWIDLPREQVTIVGPVPVTIISPLPVPVEEDTYSDFGPDEIDMPLANTEYSYTFPAGTRGFWLQIRTKARVLVKRMTGGKTFTVYPGAPIWQDGIKPTASVTIILESPTAGQIVEVMNWS